MSARVKQMHVSRAGEELGALFVDGLLRLELAVRLHTDAKTARVSAEAMLNLKRELPIGRPAGATDAGGGGAAAVAAELPR